MASQGPLSPGTLVDDNSNGENFPWANPENAASSNNTYAVCNSDANGFSHYLKATNFGFTLPAGATVNGVVVEIERKSDDVTRCSESTVRLVKGGVVSGADKGDEATGLPATDAYKSWGGAADLWSLVLAESDVNASNFGVVFEVSLNPDGEINAYVDHIRVTVHYTEAAPAGEPTHQMSYSRRRRTG